MDQRLNLGIPTVNPNTTQQPAVPNNGRQFQSPYNGNPMLQNTPFENYLGALYQQQQVVPQFLKCRPVSSRSQADAYQIDLDGSLWVFPSVANGRIYENQTNGLHR